MRQSTDRHEPTLADRMKGYEKAQATSLLRRVPVIVRVDGRAFHTLTRKAHKPYDSWIMQAMIDATHSLARSMDGCVLAYTQSDEASFLLCDYTRLETSPWFGYDLQKVVSLTASGMTQRFYDPEMVQFFGRMGEFDARAFNVPAADVANYFLWRAKDWHRNSVQMMAQAYFTPKELHGRGLPEIHEMLYKVGVNWTTDTTEQQRNGAFVVMDDDSGRSSVRCDVLPNYESVSAIVNATLPKGEQP